METGGMGTLREKDKLESNISWEGKSSTIFVFAYVHASSILGRLNASNELPALYQRVFTYSILTRLASRSMQVLCLD